MMSSVKQNIKQKFLKKIKDFSNWIKSEDFSSNKHECIAVYSYKSDSDFQIKSYLYMKDFPEPWSEGMPDRKARAYELRLIYKGSKILTEYYAAVDGGRFLVMYPEIKRKNVSYYSPTLYYYYVENTFSHDLNFVLNSNKRLYLGRMQRIPIPVFKTEEEVIEAIDDDFRMDKRRILSYNLDPVEGTWTVNLLR